MVDVLTRDGAIAYGPVRRVEFGSRAGLVIDDVSGVNVGRGRKGYRPDSIDDNYGRCGHAFAQ